MLDPIIKTEMLYNYSEVKDYNADPEFVRYTFCMGDIKDIADWPMFEDIPLVRLWTYTGDSVVIRAEYDDIERIYIQTKKTILN